MPAVFEMALSSEILTPDEIAEITGCGRRSDQIQWLTDNAWTFHKTKAGNPIVGRLYARLKLTGINPATMATMGKWVPDFSSIR
jgi:hypothetical protein